MSLEMTACRSSGFASPPLMYSRVKRPCVMNSGMTNLPLSCVDLAHSGTFAQRVYYSAKYLSITPLRVAGSTTPVMIDHPLVLRLKSSCRLPEAPDLVFPSICLPAGGEYR